MSYTQFSICAAPHCSAPCRPVPVTNLRIELRASRQLIKLDQQVFLRGVQCIKQSRLCLESSKQGYFLPCRITPMSVIPKNLFTPQNVANDQGINLRVVPASKDTHGLSYHHQSRPQRIYSFCFSPNLSKILQLSVYSI